MCCRVVCSHHRRRGRCSRRFWCKDPLCQIDPRRGRATLWSRRADISASRDFDWNRIEAMDRCDFGSEKLVRIDRREPDRSKSKMPISNDRSQVLEYEICPRSTLVIACSSFSSRRTLNLTSIRFSSSISSDRLAPLQDFLRFRPRRPSRLDENLCREWLRDEKEGESDSQSIHLRRTPCRHWQFLRNLRRYRSSVSSRVSKWRRSAGNIERISTNQFRFGCVVFAPPGHAFLHLELLTFLRIGQQTSGVVGVRQFHSGQLCCFFAGCFVLFSHTCGKRCFVSLAINTIERCFTFGGIDDRSNPSEASKVSSSISGDRWRRDCPPLLSCRNDDFERRKDSDEVRSDCREEDSAQWMNDRSRRERNECLIASSRDLSESLGVRSKLGFFWTSRMAFGNSCSGTFDRQFVGVSTADMNEIPREQCDIPLRTQRFLQNLNTTIDRSTNGLPASFEFHWPRWWLDKDPKDLFHPRQSTIELWNNDIAVHRATGLSKRNSSSVLKIVSEKRTVVLNEFQFGCQRQRRHFEVRRQLFEDVLFLIFYAQLEIDLHFGVCRWLQRRMEMSFDRRETLLRAERAFELDRCEDLVRLDIDWREDLRDEDAHRPHVCRWATTVEPKNITDTFERSVVHWRRRPFVEELARSCLVLWCFGMFVFRRDDSIEDSPAEHSNTRAMTNERNSCSQMNFDASLDSCIDTATNRDIHSNQDSIRRRSSHRRDTRREETCVSTEISTETLDEEDRSLFSGKERSSTSVGNGISDSFWMFVFDVWSPLIGWQPISIRRRSL